MKYFKKKIKPYLLWYDFADAEQEETFKNIYNEPGFTKIAPRNFLGFHIAGDDGRVYVSIRTKTKLIADDFPILNDQSVIVDKNGTLKETKYGEIWVDTNGQTH